LAQFEVLREVRLVNCSGERMHLLDRLDKSLGGTWTPEDVDKAVWSDINEAFSEPVERGDSSLDYVPTQILAEAFKRHGFDGVAYKSSYGEAGLNMVLFDIEAANLITCGLHRVKDVTLVTDKVGEPYFVGDP
jgi:hypothetical protein